MSAHYHHDKQQTQLHDPLRFSWFTLLLLSPMKRISSDMVLVSSYAPLALIRSSSALSHPRCPHAWPVYSIEKGYYVFFFFFLIEALCSRTGGSNNRGHAGILSTGAFFFCFFFSDLCLGHSICSC